MTQSARRVGRVILGCAFLVLGVLGLFLPVLQGILFLTIGLSLLSTESERAQRWKTWLAEKVRHAKVAQEGETRHGIE